MKGLLRRQCVRKVRQQRQVGGSGAPHRVARFDAQHGCVPLDREANRELEVERGCGEILCTVQGTEIGRLVALQQYAISLRIGRRVPRSDETQTCVVRAFKP